MSRHYHLYDIMERDLLFLPCLLSSDHNTYYSSSSDTEESTVSLLMVSDVSCYKRAQACRYGWQLLISVRTVINILMSSREVLSPGQPGPSRPRHYIASSLHQQRFISRFTTLRKMLSSEMTMYAKISRTYTVTPYNGATCIIPKRLYKLVIWCGEINTMIVSSLSSTELLRECTPICLSARFIRVNQIYVYTLFNIWILIH